MPRRMISKVLTPEMLLDLIPQFDGTHYVLTDFINACEEIYYSYCNRGVRERDENHWILFNAAINNLEGPAEDLAYNYNCNHIKGLIKLLKNNFAYNGSPTDLLTEITFIKSHPKEHPIQFLDRLEEKRISIINIYESDGMPEYEIDNLIHELNYTLVTTLVNGVHPLLRSHLRSFQIQDLDDARDILLNDCRVIFKKLKYNRYVQSNDSEYTESYTHYSMSYEFPNYGSNSYHRQRFQNGSNQYINNYQIQPKQNFRRPSRNYQYQQNHQSTHFSSTVNYSIQQYKDNNIHGEMQNHQSKIKILEERVNALTEKFDKLTKPFCTSSKSTSDSPRIFEFASIGNSPPYFLDYKNRKWSVVTGSEKSYIHPALVSSDTRRYREDFSVRTLVSSCNGTEYIYFNLENIFSEAKSVKLYLMDFPCLKIDILLGWDVLRKIGVEISISERRLTYGKGLKRLIFPK